MIDAAGAGLDIRAAEFFLFQFLPEPRDDRRPRHEHRGIFRHHRIVARGQPRGAEACHRTETKPDHRHDSHVGHRVPVPTRAADAARQIGRALGLDGLHRTAAAGALDHADDR